MHAITYQKLEDQIDAKTRVSEDEHPIPITSACHPGPVLVALDRNAGSLLVHCPCGDIITNVMVTKAPVH